MKIKRKELLRLNNGIAMLEGRQFSVKFSYFIAKNKVLMKDEVVALQEAKKAGEGYREFDLERARMAQEHADKNEDGSAKIHDNSFVITAKAEEFQEKLSALREKYAKPIKEFEAQMEQFNDLLEEEIDFEGTKVNLKDIPPQIEPAILEALILADLIVEED